MGKHVVRHARGDRSNRSTCLHFGCGAVGMHNDMHYGRGNLWHNSAALPLEVDTLGELGKRRYCLSMLVLLGEQTRFH